ncbi:uncharacterized protein RSE6_06621 [Rhynchosporium secalis]|uniref:Uncharacterized protein n=1 Tax=Rhynchosporium secalis TaxID=38038 RepID=A0A1E1MAV6_RHYSE|nr:uncharacterized protein RSE6_06621 [Rhynchosporium secalis]
MSTDSTATLQALDEGFEATQTLTLPYRGPAPYATPTNAISQNFAYHPSLAIDPNKIFRTHIVHVYKTDRLGTKSWSCRVCEKPATTVYHSSASLLSPLGSSLVDELIFSCNSPSCTKYGLDLANHFGKYQIPESQVTSCEICDKKSIIKLCGGCTFSYGSRNGNSHMTTQSKKPRNRGARGQQNLKTRQFDPAGFETDPAEI